MRRELESGFALDDDRDRIDVDAVHAYLTRAYWALGRPREVVAGHVRRSARVVGLYQHGAQVGFSRIESDGVSFAWLFDVYVLPEHRGRGYGIELARFAVDEGPHKDLRFMLHTRDAFTLYERLGFATAGPRAMERPGRVIGPLDEPRLTRPLEQCQCGERSGTKLVTTHKPNPLRCLDCSLEIDPASLDNDIAEQIAGWHAAHGAIGRLAADGGAYGAWARAELFDPESATNARGRRLAGAIGSHLSLAGPADARPTTACPLCRGPLRAHAGQLICDVCATVTAGLDV